LKADIILKVMIEGQEGHMQFVNSVMNLKFCYFETGSRDHLTTISTQWPSQICTEFAAEMDDCVPLLEW